MEYKQFDKSWRKILEKEIEKPYFKELEAFLKKERETKKVFPAEGEVFTAFNTTPFDTVKVVIVGQDPYHTKEKANGLAFSVHPNLKHPPSLRNIYKEIETDIKQPPKDLLTLSKEGVFLLNTILTVEENAPLSHKNKGWERFTDCVLKSLWESDKKIVFLLWGNQAKKKMREIFIGKSNHLVLTAGHPSPLSARYFFGCKHFTKANAFLKKQRGEVDWSKK